MNLKDKTVVIDNKTYRYSKIVILPTNEKAKYHDLIKNGSTIELNPWGTGQNYLKQHIYFLSTDKICKGDFWYNEDLNIISNKFDGNPSLTCDKVIASTDPSLNLPKPSDSFLQVYIDAYNKGQKIEECLIEYEEYFEQTIGDKVEVIKDLHGFYKGTLITIKEFNFKGDPNIIDFEENNTEHGFHISHLNITTINIPKTTKGEITIRKAKENWNREEVIKLLNKFRDYIIIQNKTSYSNMESWINDNL